MALSNRFDIENGLAFEQDKLARPQVKYPIPAQLTPSSPAAPATPLPTQLPKEDSWLDKMHAFLRGNTDTADSTGNVFLGDYANSNPLGVNQSNVGSIENINNLPNAKPEVADNGSMFNQFSDWADKNKAGIGLLSGLAGTVANYDIGNLQRKALSEQLKQSRQLTEQNKRTLADQAEKKAASADWAKRWQNA